MNPNAVVEVLEAVSKDREGSFKNDQGEMVDYKTRKQAAKLEVAGFAYPYEVRLEDGQATFPVGRYRLALEKMLKVNNGALSLNKFAVLEPLGSASAPKQ